MKIRLSQRAVSLVAIAVAIGYGLGVATIVIFFPQLNGTQPSHSHSGFDPQQRSSRTLGESRLVASTPKIETATVIDDLRGAWDNIRNNKQIHMGHIGNVVEVLVGLIDEEGLYVLNELRSSVLADDMRAAVMSSVIQNLAEKSSFEQLFHSAQEIFQDKTRIDILGVIASAWAKVAPIQAFAAATELGTLFNAVKLQESVVRVWVDTDPKSLEELLHTVPHSIKPTATWLLMLSNAREQPARAVERLPELVGRNYENLLSITIAQNWRSRDFEGALEWVESHKFTSQRTRNLTTAVLLYELVQEDQDRAFAIALQQQGDQFGKGPEAYLVEQIAMNDVDLAIEMLPKVREGDSTVHAYLAIGYYLSAQYEYMRAVELAKNVPFENRPLYFERVFQNWAENSPGDLLENLSRLPSDMQSFAALSLVSLEPNVLVLSKKEQEHVLSYLSDEEREQYSQRISRLWDFGPIPMDPDVANPYLGEERRNSILKVL